MVFSKKIKEVIKWRPRLFNKPFFDYKKMWRILAFLFLIAISTISVQAAEVDIDSTVHATATSHSGSSPTVVFISDQVGYAFYRDSTGVCAYSKTINGGTVWGAAVTVDAQTDCYHIGVWYDQWTPGDTSGANIHIVTMDAGDLWYTKLNTTNDSLTTTVNATGANQGGAFVPANIPSITKSTAEVVYTGVQDVSDSFVIKCGASCDTATNWTEAGTNPFDLAEDYLILMPLSGGNIIAIRDDISADAINSKEYNSSTNSWDTSWTVIDALAPENGTHDSAFGATVNKTTGSIYFAYAADIVTLGTNDDIRSAIYSNGAWTAKTNALTNDTKGITGAKIALNENNGDVYVLYSARTAVATASTGNVYYKKSIDGMASWGAETQVNATAGDIYGACVNIMSNERLYATWDSATVDDLFGNTVIDLTPIDTTAPSAVSNLALFNPTNNSIDLAWTSPGDDNGAGTATSYDLRYSTSIINEGNWAGATQAVGEPAPQIAGTPQSMTVSGLNSNTTYYFALKTSDEVPNTSAISNVPSLATSAVSDTTAPAAVTNLAVSSTTATTATLTWVAPGDDNNTGTATSYDIRYSTSAITEGNWAAATQVTGEPTPQIAGSSETMTGTGLSQSTTYFFALKTSDEVPNISTISNSPSGTTLASADTTAPATVSNLALSNATNNSIDLTWTSPGDDNSTGTATNYDVRYSTSVITEGNWAAATQATGEPAPQIAGTSQSMTVSGLNSNTTYYFALKTSDEVPNTSAISNVPSLATTAVSDTTAPAAVSNLSLSSPTTSSITVSWTAPGDDNNTGTATTYDMRYSTSVINDSNWGSATQVSGEPTPSIAGSSESKVVSGLNSNTTYYFALKTSDEVPNTSAISNVPSLATLAPQPPVMPINFFPINDASGQDLNVALTGSAYSDPENDPQTDSDWQVDDDADFATLVWTRTAGTAEISVQVSASAGTFANELAGKTELDHNSAYYWRVRYSDGTWSNWSVSTAFTTNLVNTPTNLSPANAATVVTLTPLLSASSFSDQQSGHTHAASRWVIDNNADFSSPVYDSGETLTAETSRAVPVEKLSNLNTYYWIVKYKDSAGSWSASSTATYFDINVSFASINVRPVFGNTTVDQGDTVKIDVQVINFTDGSPLNNAASIVNIYNPSGSKIVDGATMTYVSGSNGIYRYSYTIPAVSGSYLYEVIATQGSKSGYGASNFEVRTIAADVSSTLADLQKQWTVYLSDFSRILAGQTYRAKLRVLNYESAPTDAVSAPTLTIYDAVRNKVVENVAMTKLSAGVYEYIYTVPSSAVQGVWETVVSTTVETGKNIQTNDYWEVEGSPAQVKINSISDNTVPTVSANVTITNEGTAQFEYHYEYCVVAEQTNSCGGNDDIAYALAAKLINPGQDFISDLALAVLNTGNYYFKIMVYWGTERSGASRQFTAVSVPVEASVLATVGGGGGGGGTAQAVQPVSFFDLIWQKITDIFTRIFSTDAKVSQLERRVVNLEAAVQKAVALAVQKAITPAVSKEVKVSPEKEKFRIKFK